MSKKMLGKITVTPETIVAGQSVFIEVNSLEGKSLTISDDITVRINGVIGPNQYLQFDKPGIKTITVSAGRGEDLETQSIEVAVADLASPGPHANMLNPHFQAFIFNPKIQSLPILNVTRSKAQPYKAVFSLGKKYLGSNYFSEGTQPPSTEKSPHSNVSALSIATVSLAHKFELTANVEKNTDLLRGLKPVNTANNNSTSDTGLLMQQALMGSEFLHGIFKNAKSKEKIEINESLKPTDNFALKYVATPIPGGITVEPFNPTDGITFRWDFGNGASLITQEMAVEHDFEASLDPDTEHHTFHIKCTIIQKGQPDIMVARTLYVHNAYALCKKMGSLVPKTLSSGFATKALNIWEGFITVNNVEPYPLVLESKFIYPLMSDGNHLTIPINEDEHIHPYSLVKNERTTAIDKKPSISRAANTSAQKQAEKFNFPSFSKLIIVPAKGSLLIPVTVPHSILTDDAIGFAVIYTGTTSDGIAVRSEAFFDIPAKYRKNNNQMIGDISFNRLSKNASDVLNDFYEKKTTKADQDKKDDAKIPFSTKAKLYKVSSGLSFINATTIKANSLPNAERSILLNSGINSAELDNLPSNLGLLHKLVSDTIINPKTINHPTASATIKFLSEVGALGDGTIRFMENNNNVPPPPVEGQECDPDNMPNEVFDDPNTDWACQATPETRQIATASRFLNARKGDIVLSPGGPGLIGQLLRQVSPPQLYSHSGIMTRNYDQITHSTASEDRLMDYPVGSILGKPTPTDGHRPDVLKYGWPGVITQSIGETVNGKDYNDPESGKLYRISGFSGEDTGVTVGGIWEIIHPIVIRPDYILESKNVEIRKKLHQVADEAASMEGKSHYRFYCYTDPTIADDPSKAGPSDSGWAKDTIPTVCSSFIWHCLKKHGVHLESDNEIVSDADLESTDKVRDGKIVGGEVNSDTKDGLYLYNADERLAGGEYLFNSLKDKIEEKLNEKGILGDVTGFLSDIKDDVANQMLNAFGSDWCDTEAKDSDVWRNAVAANAVSPDNIFLWDSPEQNGLYGSFAPLVYRESRVETVSVSKWRKVLVKGSLSGIVRFNGNPISGVLVQLQDGTSTSSLSPDGRYLLEHVNLGSYTIKASFTDTSTGTQISANLPVNLTASQNSFDIDLQGPSDLFRKLKIDAVIDVFDYKEIGKNQSNNERKYRELYVGPFGTHAETTMVTKADDGDNVGSFRIVADWNTDKSIFISFTHTMEEGGDNEGTVSQSFNLPADWWHSWTTNIKNGQVGGSDTSTVNVTFTNEINPH